MRRLILVKHAAPLIQPGVPSDRWPLSPAGKEAAIRLADRLRVCNAVAIITSREPKACDMAGVLGQCLNLPVKQAEGLHEHERRLVPHLPTREFLSLMAQVFKRPGELILGEETAGAALARFRGALEKVTEEYPQGNLIVSTHGTVIALLAASLGGPDGYQLWRQMGLPSYLVLEDAPLRVVERVCQPD